MSSQQWLGICKYVVLLPLLAPAIHHSSSICFHVLLLSFLRISLHKFCQMLSKMLFLVKPYLVNSTEFIDYHQVDRESHWDNPIIFQALLITAAWTWLPLCSNVPFWNGKGVAYLLLVHGAVAEPLYYMMHRFLHKNQLLFLKFHSHHHASVTTEPNTGGTASFLEHSLQVMVMAVPTLAVCLLGAGSISMLYIYLLAFDFLNILGHSNVEIVPLWLFTTIPFLRYFIYTPTHHSLHHQSLDSNFCLFMPLYDYLGGTLHSKTHSLHAELRKGRKERVPDYVFLTHMVDFISSMHCPFVFRTFASRPYKTQWFTLLLWPIAFAVGIPISLWAQPFTAWSYYFRDRYHEVWAVSRYGFQYFLPSAKREINKLIEAAILDADKRGVKVISLAALNKNEALNGGGTLFVKKHENLRVRVVHGNTMTAAVILNEVPKDAKEVFLTGATSKLGRAIALYLCRKGVHVMMLTSSRERFTSIQKEVPLEYQQNLCQVTKYQAGRNCKIWIVGKWLNYWEQKMAPAGAHFYQFTVPPVIQYRSDCTYGKPAALRLPQHAKGLSSCEYTLDRQVIHACHAGGVVHALEGWDHHEVGALDVEQIDVVWEAALRHGLTPV